MIFLNYVADAVGDASMVAHEMAPQRSPQSQSQLLRQHPFHQVSV